MLTLKIDNDCVETTSAQRIKWTVLRKNDHNLGIAVSAPTKLKCDLSNACTLCLPPALTETMLAVPFYLQIDTERLKCSNGVTESLHAAATVLNRLSARDTCERTAADYDDESSETEKDSESEIESATSSDDEEQVSYSTEGESNEDDEAY